MCFSLFRKKVISSDIVNLILTEKLKITVGSLFYTYFLMLTGGNSLPVITMLYLHMVEFPPFPL